MTNGGLMSQSLIETLLSDKKRELESIRITRGPGRGDSYIVTERRIVKYNPEPGEVYAELTIKKPRGEVLYAADQIFVERKVNPTGIAFLDEGARAQPDYEYLLNSKREIAQANIARKLQEKSPCCNRTMSYVSRGHGLRDRRVCRKCNKEVPHSI